MDQTWSKTGFLFVSRPSVELCAKWRGFNQPKQLRTKMYMYADLWHCRFKPETYNFLQDRNYFYFAQFYSVLQMKGQWESDINVLFLISFTLKPTQIKNWLQGLIVSIYDP